MSQTTRAESEFVASILEVVRGTPSHAATAQTFVDYFQSDAGWGTAAVSMSWREDDLALMRRTLGAWFSPDRFASPA